MPYPTIQRGDISGWARGTHQPKIGNPRVRLVKCQPLASIPNPLPKIAEPKSGIVVNLNAFEGKVHEEHRPRMSDDDWQRFLASEKTSSDRELDRLNAKSRSFAY